jgi:hypothetical protein
MKKGISGIVLLFFTSAAFALDFGVVLGSEGSYTGAIEPEGFSVTGYASPWFSAVVSEKANFHVSGRMTYKYAENREPAGTFFFEPERTELNLHPVSAIRLSLGRQRFQDALEMTASGLFDGAGGSVNVGPCRLSLGAFYTGLLYKETAKIIMTAGDLEKYAKPLEAEGLEDYFASRRVLLALTGAFPALTPRTSLTVEGLAQFDVNDTPDALDTQYLELRFAAELLEGLYFDAGALGELIREREGGEVQRSAAVTAGLDWEVPGVLNDLLSAKFLWTAGRSGSEVRAFTPVGGIPAGKVFDPGLRALMRAGLSWQARLHGAVSAEGEAAYFIRTDVETLQDADMDGSSKSRLLGGEVYGSLVWAPDIAFRLNGGGGAFFPGWGGAFRGDAAVRWKVHLGVLVSL